MTDSLARSLVDAAAALRESEIIAIERNNPPDTKCRELWPLPAEPLAVLLESFAPLARRVQQDGVAWGNEKALNAAVSLARAVLSATTEDLADAIREGRR